MAPARAQLGGGEGSVRRWRGDGADVQRAPTERVARQYGRRCAIRLTRPQYRLPLPPLTFPLSPPTGSGKSSILAAIIVALGGNPNRHSAMAGGAKSAAALIRDLKENQGKGNKDPEVMAAVAELLRLKAILDPPAEGA